MHQAHVQIGYQRVAEEHGCLHCLKLIRWINPNPAIAVTAVRAHDGRDCAKLKPPCVQLAFGTLASAERDITVVHHITARARCNHPRICWTIHIVPTNIMRPVHLQNVSRGRGMFHFVFQCWPSTLGVAREPNAVPLVADATVPAQDERPPPTFCNHIVIPDPRTRGPGTRKEQTRKLCERLNLKQRCDRRI